MPCARSRPTRSSLSLVRTMKPAGWRRALARQPDRASVCQSPGSRSQTTDLSRNWAARQPAEIHVAERLEREKDESRLVADDYRRPDADDPLPGDDGVAVHLCLSGTAAALGADAVALEDAEFAGDETGDPQAASDELSADAVDAAQFLT